MLTVTSTGDKKSPEKRIVHESSEAIYGGGRRIRTSEVVRRQIYSLFPLATRESLQVKISRFCNSWSWRWDSNPQPADYKSAALPIELRQRKLSLYTTLAAESSVSAKNRIIFIKHFRFTVNIFLFYFATIFVFCPCSVQHPPATLAAYPVNTPLITVATDADSQYISQHVEDSPYVETKRIISNIAEVLSRQHNTPLLKT
jgi:hypothetical protein